MCSTAGGGDKRIKEPRHDQTLQLEGSPGTVLRKNQYHELIASMPVQDICDEVRDLLDRIQAVADAAKPADGRRPAKRQPSIRP